MLINRRLELYDVASEKLDRAVALSASSRCVILSTVTEHQLAALNIRNVPAAHRPRCFVLAAHKRGMSVRWVVRVRGARSLSSTTPARTRRHACAHPRARTLCAGLQADDVASMLDWARAVGDVVQALADASTAGVGGGGPRRDSGSFVLALDEDGEAAAAALRGAADADADADDVLALSSSDGSDDEEGRGAGGGGAGGRASSAQANATAGAGSRAPGAVSRLHLLRQSSFTVVDDRALLLHQRRDTHDVCAALGVAVGDAVALLKAFGWEVGRVMQAWEVDPQGAMRSAGIRAPVAGAAGGAGAGTAPATPGLPRQITGVIPLPPSVVVVTEGG